MKLITTKVKLKVAIIGTGFGVYGLLPAFELDKRCTVVAICSLRKDTKFNYKKLKKISFFNDYLKMIEIAKPDIVAIATTPKNQESIVDNLKSRKINFFCEKSFGISYVKLKNIYKKINILKFKTCIDFVYPEIVEFKHIKKIISLREEIVNMKIKWFFFASYNKTSSNSWKKNISDGGGIMHLYGSHILYYLIFFLGEIKKSIKIKETKTYLKILLFFENKHTCIIEINTQSLENKHEIKFNSANNKLTLITQDPLRFHGFEIIDNNRIAKNKLTKSKKNRLNKDMRYTYVNKIVERFIDSIIYNKNMKPDHNDGLKNLYWINKINRQKVKK